MNEAMELIRGMLDLMERERDTYLVPMLFFLAVVAVVGLCVKYLPRSTVGR
jgi:ABC-type transport system involved in cytochrome c biogenesis permease component